MEKDYGIINYPKTFWQHWFFLKITIPCTLTLEYNQRICKSKYTTFIFVLLYISNQLSQRWIHYGWGPCMIECFLGILACLSIIWSITNIREEGLRLIVSSFVLGLVSDNTNVYIMEQAAIPSSMTWSMRKGVSMGTIPCLATSSPWLSLVCRRSKT